MQKCGKMEVQIHKFMILALDWDKFLASRCGSFTPKERIWVPNGQERMCDCTAGLENVASSKTFLPEVEPNNKPWESNKKK
jgi:hypothetical protein